MLPDECHSNISEIRPNRTKDIGLHNGTFCGRTKNNVKQKTSQNYNFEKVEGKRKGGKEGEGEGKEGRYILGYWVIKWVKVCIAAFFCKS